MTYKIKENAKNVWIRNNENTQDLSPLTDANSVYFNNGRTLEQELGKGVMESNIVTVNSFMEKVIDEAYDGTYESLVFKGKSLVNLATQSVNYGLAKHSNITSEKITVNVQASKEIKFTVVQEFSEWIYITVKINLDMLKPNTKYLVVGESIKNINYARICRGDTTHNLEQTPYPYFGNSNCVVLTTNDLTNYVHNDITLYLKPKANLSVGSEVHVKNVMLIEYQEDMENWGIPYFEGLCDSKMPILRNVGENLFDGSAFYGSLNGGTGAINSNPNGTRLVTTNAIKLVANKPYSISAYDEDDSRITFVRELVIFSDKECTNRIGQWGNRITKATYTPNQDCYIRFTTLTVDNNDAEIRSDLNTIAIQIEQSSISTTYEPYKSNILSTPEEVVLRGNSDTQDTYNTLTGEYIQRVGEIVLDGTDSTHVWNRNDEWSAGDIAVFWSSNVVNMSGNFILCDKFLTLQKDDLIVDNVCVQEGVRYGATFIQISIKKSKLSSPDVTGFKKWLQSNPITVQYELAEPVTTVIEPSTIPFIYQNGHIILESGYKGQSLTPILEYTASVSRTGQVENVAKTIQRHETQLTLLEKMLIGNIIELDYNNTLMALNLKMDGVK